jgi:hypothetical protein
VIRIEQPGKLFAVRSRLQSAKQFNTLLPLPTFGGNLGAQVTIDALKSLPKEVADFPGFVRDEFEKIEWAQAAKK